jgi:hypothetical protein
MWPWLSNLLRSKRSSKSSELASGGGRRLEELLKGSGKIQIATLLEFANSVQEQEFVETITCYSLVGSAIRDGQIGQLISAPNGAQSFQTFVFKAEQVEALLKGSSIEQSVFLLKKDARGTPSSHYSRFTIGRGKENDVRIVDFAISRVHARIELDGDGFIARDCNSRNGTRVNGANVSPSGHRLKDGDTITFGRYDFAFLSPRSLYTKLRRI